MMILEMESYSHLIELAADLGSLHGSTEMGLIVGRVPRGVLATITCKRAESHWQSWGNLKAGAACGN